jgi:hypothetical protein
MALLSITGTLFWIGETTLGNTISGLRRHQADHQDTVRKVREKKGAMDFAI